MGLENLSSPFADISKNSMEPQKVTSANSVIKSKESDELNFGANSPFYQPDNIFRSKTQDLISGNSQYNTLEHSFASQGQYDDIQKINEITIDDSKMTPRLVEYQNPNANDGAILPHIMSENSNQSIDTRQFAVNGEGIGLNRQLGVGQFKLTSLYKENHRGAANREPIPLGRSDHEGNPLFVNTLRAGMGSFKGLNIKGHSSFFRTGLIGDGEPYVVNKIGARNFGGNNRDILPFNRALEDVSRLAQFYTSFAGLFYIGRENLTNLVIKPPTKDPLRIVDHLRSRILAPPIPIPMTGLLNFYQQTIQAPGGVNLRKPLTSEYSKRPQNLIPFEQLGDMPIVNSLPPGTFKEKAFHNQTPFHDLGGGNKPYNPVDKFSNLPVVNSRERDQFAQGYENKGDFYVRIKDLRTKTFIYFRGYVTGITENVTPNFSSTKYVGRSEPVHVYSHGERDLSFNLRVAPQNEHQFRLMYEKLGALTSLAYPEYKQETVLVDNEFTELDMEFEDVEVQTFSDELDEDGNPILEGEPVDDIEPTITETTSTLQSIKDTGEFRMLAPFCELYMAHIGNKAKGQFGYFKSITYTVNEQGDWNALEQLPRVFDIAISYQILHRKAPSMATGFYGVQVKYPEAPPAPGNRLTIEDIQSIENQKLINSAKGASDGIAQKFYKEQMDKKSNNPGTEKLQNAKTELAKKQNNVPTILRGPSPTIKRSPSPDLLTDPPGAVSVPNLPMPGEPVPTNTV